MWLDTVSFGMLPSGSYGSDGAMDGSVQAICSCALTMGVPLVIASWELWRLKPTIWREPPGEDVPPEPDPLPDEGMSPSVRKPLPDCLVPKPIRVRELA
jgi:hypothetical protein